MFADKHLLINLHHIKYFYILSVFLISAFFFRQAVDGYPGLL
jgi:hypothetical protein